MTPNDAPDGTYVQVGSLRLWSGARERLLDVPADRFRHVTTVNAEIFVLAHEVSDFGTAVRQSCCCIDGRPLQLIARLRSGAPIERHAGADFIWDLARMAPTRHWRLFLLGASDASNVEAQVRLREAAPGLHIDGYAPPFGSAASAEDWNEAILARLRAAAPTHLLVALGPPRQELWIAQHRDALRQMGIRFAAGVGGSVDFVADVQRRAPRWVQRAGLEWLHRVLHQPSRWRRTLRLFRMFRYLGAS